MELIDKEQVQEYLNEHEIGNVLDEALNECIREMPKDPFASLAELIRERSERKKRIVQIFAVSTLNFEGKSCCEIVVDTANGTESTIVSSSHSENQEKLSFLSTEEAMDIVENAIASEFFDKDPSNIKDNDSILLDLDPSETRGKIGANVMLAASWALAKAGARVKETQLYSRLVNKPADDEGYKFPVPWIQLISVNGVHIGALPVGSATFAGAIADLQRFVEATQPIVKKVDISLEEMLRNLINALDELGFQDVIKFSLSANLFESSPTPSDDGGREKEEDQDEEQENKQTEEETDEGAVENSTEESKEDVAVESKDDESPQKIAYDETLFRENYDIITSMLSEDEISLSVALLLDLVPPPFVEELKTLMDSHGKTIVISNRSDNELGPKCNGIMVDISRPSRYGTTLSALQDTISMAKTEHTCTVLNWDKNRNICDQAFADFGLAVGVNILSLEQVHFPNSLTVVNRMLRLEKELGSQASYLGQEYRGFSVSE